MNHTVLWTKLILKCITLQDRDGVISREEMEDLVGSVFDLMGRTGDPVAEEAVISERVDQIFEVNYSQP